MGNVTTFAYDGNGNLVYRRSDGETNDVPGSVGNRRLSERRRPNCGDINKNPRPRAV